MAKITISDIELSNADSFLTDITDNEYNLIAGGGLLKVLKKVGKFIGRTILGIGGNVTIDGDGVSVGIGKGGGGGSSGSNSFVQHH